ncbi:AB hydrolase-1 domain-containing protein [Planctomycetales bacterium 10988]|nr:AB hydrolase-1 domain-containing protein [Planctomycetales bacterium 10988]
MYLILTLLLVPLAIFVVAIVGFRIIYFQYGLSIFEKVPWLKAESNPPLPDREDCTFQTRDGYRLQGSYLTHTGAECRGVILFCHEINGDRWGVVPISKTLREAGFDIFTFDFRGQGASEAIPNRVIMPWLTRDEVEDVRAAVDYVFQRNAGTIQKVGLLGTSRGASAALSLSARDSRIAGVVSDGGFPIVPMIQYYLNRFLRIYTRWYPVYKYLPAWYMRILIRWILSAYEKRHECKFAHLDKLAGQIKQPVMLIHGERDSYVPEYIVKDLGDSIDQLEELWIVPKAKHNAAYAVEPEQYGEKVTRFFARYLMAPSHQALKSRQKVCQSASNSKV